MLSFRFCPRALMVSAALCVVATTGCSSTHKAVGQDNGSLTASYASASYKTAMYDRHSTSLSHRSVTPVAR